MGQQYTCPPQHARSKWNDPASKDYWKGINEKVKKKTWSTLVQPVHLQYLSIPFISFSSVSFQTQPDHGIDLREKNRANTTSRVWPAFVSLKFGCTCCHVFGKKNYPLPPSPVSFTSSLAKLCWSTPTCSSFFKIKFPSHVLPRANVHPK